MKIKEEVNLKNAIILNAMSKYFGILINLVFTMILARLLTPEDYGVVAVVTVFTTFFSIFSDMGLGSAVVQNKELTDADNSSIYAFSIYVGIFLSVIFVIFSYPMSVFYGNFLYFKVGCILAISLFFSAINTIPNALLMKQKLFLTVAIRTVVEAISYGALTIVLALFGFKYYAIVISSVFKAVLTYFWNIKTVSLKFSVRIKKKSIEKVLGFSLFQLAFNVVNYFARNLDNLLTGKLMGSAMLGYYNKAYQLMLYPTSSLTHVITPVLHPILSEHQNDKGYVYEKYMKIVKFLAIVGVFLSAFCYLTSEEIIKLFFGNNWNITIPCFSWLSISIWAQMITSSAGSIFQSLNKTRILFISGSLNAGLNVIFIIVGAMTGDIVKLSMCVGVCYLIHFFTSYYFLMKYAFEMPVIKFFTALWKELIIGIILIAAIFIYPFNISSIFVSFAVKLMFMGTIYLIALFATKEYKVLLHIFRKR